jgi:hypothetical protein
LHQWIEQGIAKVLGSSSSTRIGSSQTGNPEQPIFRSSDDSALYGKINHSWACPI